MQIKEAWRRSTPHGRGVFLAAALAATLYGGAKPSGGNAPRRNRAVTRESLPLRSVSHRDPSYFAMPDGAETFAPWNLRGAKCDWTPANDFIAFPNGRLRPTPHDAAGELGLDFGDLAAEPGVSHLWWRTELTGTRVVTWTNLRRERGPIRALALEDDTFIGTNDVVSIELRVDENGYAIRTSDPVGGSDDDTPYNPTDDDSLYLVVSAPDCVVRDGDRRPFSVTCTSDREIEGTLTLRLVSGADKVSLWTAAAGGSPVTLPATLDSDLAGGAILYAQYEETSAAVDDIVFELTLAAGNGTVSDRSSMTAVEVVRVDVASSAAGSSETPPPFLPDDPAGFDRTHASPPDRHLVIPFCNVADAAMNVSEVSVSVPLGVDLADMRSLSFSLQLVPNATNNLEIALGFDANDDGTLDLDECDRLFGYDCGAWFEKDGRTGAVTASVPSAASATARNNRLGDAAGETPHGTVRHRWTFRRRDMDLAWNTLRLTRRGRGEPNGSVAVEAKRTGFAFILK